MSRARAPLAVFTDPDELDPEPGRRILEQAGFEVVVVGSRDRATIVDAAQGATALLVGYAPVDRSLLDSLGSVRIVSMMAVGFDSVDLAACEAHGVWVTNVPAAASEEVAVHAFALALSLVRRIGFLDRHVRQGGWAADADEPMRRPSTMTFGVVGLGRIGRRVAQIAQPVFGRVLGHDPNLDDPAWPPSVGRRSIEQLLRESDVVSLHLPGQAGGRPLLDGERLAMLPPGAALVNVARGSLVDQGALLAALDEGRLCGAALDVLALEPPRLDDPVRSHPRVILTPHLAYLSDQSAHDYVARAAENVVAWATTGQPLDVVARGREQET